jgi:FAD:protein FMN transferase
MEVFSKVQRLMGNRFELSVLDTDRTNAEKNLELAIAEIERIEALLSTFKASSYTNQVNNMAGIGPTQVPKEMLELVLRAQKISALTQGAFDLTYGGVDKSLWNFDTQMTSLPSPEKAKESVALVNYQNILIDTETNSIFLRKKGMRIGFGGIGKGYAADRAQAVLQELGYANGVVNASGDMCAWGLGPNNKHWTVGIVDPNQKHEVFGYLPLNNCAIATSGNYEKYVTIGGKRYSHTIDPQTGLPTHGIKSVSVIAPKAELADALTTPLGIMGVEVGLDLVNQLQEIACIIVDDSNTVHVSNNLKKNDSLKI